MLSNTHTKLFSLNSSVHFTLALSGFDFPLSDYFILPIEWFVVVSKWTTSFVSGWLLCASRSVVIRWIRMRIELHVLAWGLAKHPIGCKGWSVRVVNCILGKWLLSSMFRFRRHVCLCVVQNCSFIIGVRPADKSIQTLPSQQAASPSFSHQQPITLKMIPPCNHRLIQDAICFSVWALAATTDELRQWMSGWLLD
jgi:hypothetical protein